MHRTNQIQPPGTSGTITPWPTAIRPFTHGYLSTKQAERQRWILGSFWTTLVLDGLAAYAIGPIPVPWLAQAGAILAVLAATALYRNPRLPIAPMVLFAFWTLLITAINFSPNGIGASMPLNASTPYPAYVALRLVTIAAFISVVSLTYWLAQSIGADKVIKIVVTLGVAAALIGFYIYVAQIAGLPEPPRTRTGTGGGAQSTVFSYAFHRAMGTFREPSHFAEWLLVPLFCSISRARKPLNPSTITIGAALMLTGSLTGILAAVGGVGLSLLAGPKKTRAKNTLGMLMVSYLALQIFSFIAAGYNSTGFNFLDTILNRAKPIVAEGGMKNTDRDYIYEYLDTVDFSLIGQGAGSANIGLSNYLHIDVVGSLLSLYFQTLLATGIIGIGLLLFAVANPIRLFAKNRSRDPGQIWILGGYIAWLIAFGGDMEELSVMFGVAYGLVLFEGHRQAVKISQHGKLGFR